MSLLSATEASTTPGRRRGAGSRRTPRSLVAAAVAAASTYALLASGLLPGVVAIALMVVLLLAVPTAPDLARRFALNGAVLLGWVPVLWLVVWPVPVDHAALAMAVPVSVVAWRVAGADAPRAALRALVPTARRTDLLLPVSAVLALAVMWRWAFPGSPRHALETMLPGVDNASHFMMYASIVRHGAPGSSVGNAPDGSQWAFSDYPQGFHSLVATLTEVSHPRLPAGSDLLTTYTLGVALVVVLGLTVLTAAMVSLPAVRDRFWVALPAVVLTWAAFLWRPGQNLLADGFANFWLAALTAAAALLVCLTPRPRVSVAASVALGGVLVAAAYGWAPMFVLAAPAVLALAVPLKETLGDRARRGDVWLAAIALGCAAVLVVRVLLSLARDYSVGSLVSALGGIHGTSWLPTLVLTVFGLYIFSVGPARLRSRRARTDEVVAARRARVATLTLVEGVLISVLLLVAQLRSSGEIAYYFVKFIMGFELVLAGVVPAVAAMLVAAAVPAGDRRWLRIGVAAAATVVAAQFFGTFPTEHVPMWDAERPGTAALSGTYSGPRLVAGVLAATSGFDASNSLYVDYVPIGSHDAIRVVSLDNWFHALTGSASSRTADRAADLLDRVQPVEGTAPRVRTLLRDHPEVTVVVAPEHVVALRQRLGDAALEGRVVSW